MAVFDNLNYSSSPGVAPGVVEYHDRQLLKDMLPELVHTRDTQKRPLPENNGNRIQFRKFTPFGVVTTPLKEGVTPEGQALSMTEFWATIKAYGAHVELTDVIQWTLLDDTHKEANRLLANQAALSVDTLARDVLHSGSNVLFAGGRASRAALTTADILTPDLIKRAVLSLRKQNAKPFEDGLFHAVLSPSAEYDLTNNALWQDIVRYQDKSKFEKYELGSVWGVKFFGSTNAKVFKTETYLYGTTASLAITNGTWDAAKRTLKTAVALTAHECLMLTGKLVNIKGSTGVLTPMCIENVRVDGTITLRWDPGATVTANWATGVSIQPNGGGAGGIDVHSTLVYARDYAGSVELGGVGRNVQTIAKPAGSSGAADPLNQRATLAWKIKGFTTVILQDIFGVRLEHAATT